ncbi:hypothetical protein CLOM_g351 [Closterium sp. NIES-68]|nr:hypothetical protein CLOM_g351 [Closterium sp. NIES-68]GJP85366.1 hypothetical protein CLOP_g15464 [Closterium sp. NIES-67]
MAARTKQLLRRQFQPSFSPILTSLLCFAISLLAFVRGAQALTEQVSLLASLSGKGAAGTLSLLVQKNATRYNLRYTLVLTGTATAPKRIALYQRQQQQPSIAIPLPPLACSQPVPSVWHCSSAAAASSASPSLPAAPLAALFAAAGGGANGGAASDSSNTASGNSGIGFSATVVGAGSSTIGALTRAKAFYNVPSAFAPVLYPTAAAPLGGAARGGTTLSVSATNALAKVTYLIIVINPSQPLRTVKISISTPTSSSSSSTSPTSSSSPSSYTPSTLALACTWTSPIPSVWACRGTAMAAQVSPAAKAVAALPALPAGVKSACAVGVSVRGGVTGNQAAQGMLIRVAGQDR